MLSAVAAPLVKILLTNKWESCIILLQIVCFAQMWYPIHAINLNLLQVKGRSDLFFRLEIFKKAIGISIMCVTIPKGLIWMVSGSVISSMLSLIINTYYTGKLINVGYFKQMRDLLPICGVSFIMWISIQVSLWLVSNILLQLVVGIIIGIIVYLIGAKLLLRVSIQPLFWRFEQ